MGYIDETVSEIITSQNGLLAPYSFIQSCVQENKNYLIQFRFRIVSMANKNDLPFESDDFETKEHLRKKLKIEKTQ